MVIFLLLLSEESILYQIVVCRGITVFYQSVTICWKLELSTFKTKYSSPDSSLTMTISIYPCIQILISRYPCNINNKSYTSSMATFYSKEPYKISGLCCDITDSYQSVVNCHTNNLLKCQNWSTWSQLHSPLHNIKTYTKSFIWHQCCHLRNLYITVCVGTTMAYTKDTCACYFVFLSRRI